MGFPQNAYRKSKASDKGRREPLLRDDLALFLHLLLDVEVGVETESDVCYNCGRDRQTTISRGGREEMDKAVRLLAPTKRPMYESPSCPPLNP